MVRKNVRDNVVYVSNGYDTRRQYGREIPLEQINWITGRSFPLRRNRDKGGVQDAPHAASSSPALSRAKARIPLRCTATVTCRE